MLTVLAALAVIAILAATACLVSAAAGGCLWSNLWLWFHLGDAIDAVGQLVAFIGESLSGSSD